MDRLEALKAFVAVAQRQSFAEAARNLRISPTAASRAVTELETSLGVTLLRRTTRSVSVTPEGAIYLERCRAALEEIDNAERSLRGENAAPHGKLIITAPVVFGRQHMLPVVARLLRAYPKLEVQLLLTDRVIRLVEEGIDVAVRIADLSDSALHAIRVAQVHRVLVASPAYIAERGDPQEVAHLHSHDLIAFDNLTQNGEWRFTQAGRPAIRFEPRMLTNSVEAAIDAALAGLGITRALCYQVAEHVRAGRLRYVLANYDPPGVPVSLLFQGNRRSVPNVRALIAETQAYCAETNVGCANEVIAAS
jgi:DNA-binding transcriptional LysR family regulator